VTGSGPLEWVSLVDPAVGSRKALMAYVDSGPQEAPDRE
jgi:hypothetical protein